MFSVDERTAIREHLVSFAAEDPSIAGAALAGSAARGEEDEWSDIDLILQLSPNVSEIDVVARWSDEIDARFGVADTTDVMAGGVRYRVFFLASSLQIDVSFWPHDLFRATEPGFRVLFGTPNPPTLPSAVDVQGAIGMAWLYAIHARSSLARGRLWQATMMLDEMQHSLITLLCVRVGLIAWHGREVDKLPTQDLAMLAACRATGVSVEELDRSRRLLTQELLREIGRHDPHRAARLARPFTTLSEPVLTPKD